MAEDDANDNGNGIAEKFGQIATDLINIEVNTIVQRGITGQKMPVPRHALIDLGKEYHSELEIMVGQFEESVHFHDANGRPPAESEEDEAKQQEYREAIGAFRQLEESEAYGGFTAFDAYRNLAKVFLANHPEEHDYVTARQRSILPRIKDNSDLIKGMMSALCSREIIKGDPKQHEQELDGEDAETDTPKIARTPNYIVDLCRKANPKETDKLNNEYSRTDLITEHIDEDPILPLGLSENELVFLRKAWELGTAVVAMQTVIQIDGDVINRLNPLMLDKNFQQLNDYHRAGVNISLQHWSDLVNVAKELVVGLVRGIGGG